jgi:hypothetical protein
MEKQFVQFFWFRGPDDNGLVVDGPGRLAKKAFENGALHVNEINMCFCNLFVFRRIVGTRW